MKYSLNLLIALFILVHINSSAQETLIKGDELLKRSISFHDPNGQWLKIKLELVLDQEMPDGSIRPSNVIIDNKKGEFKLSFIKNSHLYTWKVDGKDSTESFMDYRAVTDSIALDTLGLRPDRARRWRNYYSYIYGLPMKLADRGTKIDQTVRLTEFDGKEVLALKVTYEANVGKDIWYFYFNPNTYAMEGYRFYHDESINDGEYILINGLEINNGIRIPKDRAWYTNDENKWLGTDRFIKMKVIK